MDRHWHRQLDRMNSQLLAVVVAQCQLLESIGYAFETREPEFARRLSGAISQTERLNRDLEEECLHALAFYQPRSDALRTVARFLKVSLELHRASQLLRRIAMLAAHVANHDTVREMSSPAVRTLKRLKQLMRHAADAYVLNDLDLNAELLPELQRLTDDLFHIDRLLESRIDRTSYTPRQVLSILELTGQIRQLNDCCLRISDAAAAMAESFAAD